jgi:hypothetical protein
VGTRLDFLLSLDLKQTNNSNEQASGFVEAWNIIFVLLRFNTKFIELDKTKLCSPEAHII